jgi:hypothetical protein
MIGRIMNRISPGYKGVARIDGVIAQFDRWIGEIMEGKASITEQMVANEIAMQDLQAEQDYLERRMTEATRVLRGIEALRGGTVTDQD